MSVKLSIIEPTVLDVQDRQELTARIDSIIASHKGNRQAINRLVFESVSAMTMGENCEQELAAKKGLRRFFGGLTGSNKRLQDQINSNRAVAQYAAQQTIQRLAEQNLLTFDLITAVNNKLNTSVMALESEVNQIYSVLSTFFKQSRSDLIQLETRVATLERNINLLNWSSTIEYQMYNGVEYSDLSSVEKMVCLAHDFYQITNGNWSTSDLLLLKSTMAEIGLTPKATISYQLFIQGIAHNPDLQHYLLGEKFESSVIEPFYTPILAGIQKENQLAGPERYIIDSVQQMLPPQHGSCGNQERELSAMLTAQYLANEAGIKAIGNINLYDFMMELLFNLTQIGLIDSKGLGSSSDYAHKMELAEAYFISYNIVKAKPIFEELSDAGCGRAKYFLAMIYEEGYQGLEKSEEKSELLAKETYELNDPLGAIYYASVYVLDNDEIEIYKKFVPELVKAANEGDVFAQYELARYYMEDTLEPENCKLSIHWAEQADSQNFWKASCFLGKIYYGETYVSDDAIDEDIEKAIDYFKKSAEVGYGVAQYYLADAYSEEVPEPMTNVLSFKTELCTELALYWAFRAAQQNNGDAWGLLGDLCTGNLNPPDLSTAFECYQKAVDLGSYYAYYGLGFAYENGKGCTMDLQKAVNCYQIAAMNGYSYAQYNLANMYLAGRGVEKNERTAKEWLEKSAARGWQAAIDKMIELGWSR